MYLYTQFIFEEERTNRIDIINNLILKNKSSNKPKCKRFAKEFLSLGIDVTDDDTEEMMRAINVDEVVNKEYSVGDIKKILTIFKHMIKGENLKRFFFLLFLLARIMRNLSRQMLHELPFNKHKGCQLSWSEILQGLDESLVLIFLHEPKWNRKIRIKQQLVLDIYKYFFENLPKQAQPSERKILTIEEFIHECVTSVIKIILFKMNKSRLTEITGINRTAKKITENATSLRNLEWNKWSLEYPRFIELMSAVNKNMIPFLLESYLELINHHPEMSREDQKRLLAFLIVYQDPYVVARYQSLRICDR